MDKATLILELCQFKADEVKVIVNINNQIFELEINDVVYDEKSKTIKLITSEVIKCQN